MLFTRCPECDTTFRVTDETLKKANGQVRCGRCANVFNAYAELHDPGARSFEPSPPHATEGTGLQGRPGEPASAPQPVETTASSAAAEPGAELAGGDEVAATGGEREDGVEQVPASLAEVMADTKTAAAEAAAEPADETAAATETQPITASEIERVLTADPTPPLPGGAFAWSQADEPAERPSRSAWWAVAAGVALLVLAVQALHHFRSDVANDPTFGSSITAAYRKLGLEIAPTWDVHQYQILDWIATAEPNSRGLGSLKITARIQNRGPLRQPYPAVQLRLKDRWETAVASRLFSPGEYLPRDTPRGRLMSPGETARAEIEVVDPGPDAYGFELDICIEVEPSRVTCGTDEVFL